jgi:hypothetical protein
MASKKKKDSSETAIPSAKVGRPTANYAVKDVVKMVRNALMSSGYCRSQHGGVANGLREN